MITVIKNYCVCLIDHEHQRVLPAWDWNNTAIANCSVVKWLTYDPFYYYYMGSTSSTFESKMADRFELDRVVWLDPDHKVDIMEWCCFSQESYAYIMYDALKNTSRASDIRIVPVFTHPQE